MICFLRNVDFILLLLRVLGQNTGRFCNTPAVQLSEQLPTHEPCAANQSARRKLVFVRLVFSSGSRVVTLYLSMCPRLLNATVVSFPKISYSMNAKLFEPRLCRKTSSGISLIYLYNDPAHPSLVSIHLNTTATTATTIPTAAIPRPIKWAYSTMYVNHVSFTLAPFVPTALVVGVLKDCCKDLNSLGV